MKNSTLTQPTTINYFCKKKCEEKNEICLNYQSNMPMGFSVCPYGFSCYKFDEKRYCSFKIKNHFDERKIKGHIKNSPANAKFNMTIFTEEDFLNYCSNNKLENDYLLIKERHEIYRSTIHDIKSVIRSMGDIFQEINIENEQKDIMDGYDLIRTRLDYHDRILVEDNQIAAVINKINLHKLVKKLSILLSYKAATKNVKFDFEGYINNDLYIDSKAVFILLFIIMENAVKYSPKDETIRIVRKDESKSCTSINIENVCLSLEKEELEYIFDDGYRGKNGEDSSGNGIGLMVAKKIMNKLHIEYKVELKNNESKTRFSIKIWVPSLNKDGTIKERKTFSKV